jgi:hypothetical protein
MRTSKAIRSFTIVCRALGVFCLLALVCPDKSLRAEVLTFDDLTSPPSGLGISVPNGYGGLDWSNFSFKNGLTDGVGYANSVVSPNNMVYDRSGNPGDVTAIAGTFTLVSGYFTAAFRDGLQITVDGYNQGHLVDTSQFTVNTTGPTLETFNFSSIDEAVFTTSGGTLHPGYSPSDGVGAELAMDNLSVVTPEPSSLVLAALAAAGLGLVARRKTARARRFHQRQTSPLGQATGQTSRAMGRREPEHRVAPLMLPRRRSRNRQASGLTYVPAVRASRAHQCPVA